MQKVNVAFTTPDISNSSITIGTDPAKITITDVTLSDGTYSLALTSGALLTIVNNMFKYIAKVVNIARSVTNMMQKYHIFIKLFVF